MPTDPLLARALLAKRARERAAAQPVTRSLTDHHFQEQRAFWKSGEQLSAALCSRRAGKTKGGDEEWVERAYKQKHGRFLYINSTRAEAKRLAWHGARGEGMKPLAQGLGVPVKINDTELSIHFTDIDSWIYLVGVDDEAAIDKALGTPWHGVWWDEFQKTPKRFTPRIKESLLPALLDYGGDFKVTGTPERNQTSMFYEITRTDAKATPGWDVHRWTLLENPYWGRAKLIDGKWFVVWRFDDVVHSGPHSESELQAAIIGCRHTQGILGLQKLLGGPDVAPLDSAIMMRQGGGVWTREDSNFVYDVNKVPDSDLIYAPHRSRPDGFVDVATALCDLPWDWRDGMYAMGVDIGFNDPFTLTLWGWHPHDPVLYEVVAWGKDGLDDDQQNKAMQDVRQHVAIGVIDADAGGIGKVVVTGWSKQWVEKYGLPIREAQKQHKSTAIGHFNTEVKAKRVKFRDGSPLLDEMRELQWATIVDGSGRMIEDPTMPNDHCDSALYSARRSWNFRATPKDEAPPVGSREAMLRLERELEEEQDYDN